MKQLARWCKGRPDCVVMLAQGMAEALEQIDAVLEAMRSDTAAPVEGIPFERWRWMYTHSALRHAATRQALADALGAGGRPIGTAEIRGAISAYAQDREAMEAKLKAKLQEHIDAERYEPVLLLQLQTTFLLHVELRALVYFDVPACWLLYRARHGDVEDVAALLSLDPLMQRDRLVAQRFFEIQAAGDRGDRETLLKAMRGKPGPPKTRRAVKEMVAAIMRVASELEDAPISYRDLRTFFDALQPAVGPARWGTDTDLQDDLESWKKAVGRKRRQVLRWFGLDSIDQLA